VYEKIIQIVKIKGFCVVVIAEGAESGLIDSERDHLK